MLEEPTGITQHPGFHWICINWWVLQTAWFQYKQQFKDPYDGLEHKLNFRHKAHRQLAWWFWEILGKEIRVILPSCSIIWICNFYSPLGKEEEFAFEGFWYADEWFELTINCLHVENIEMIYKDLIIMYLGLSPIYCTIFFFVYNEWVS